MADLSGANHVDLGAGQEGRQLTVKQAAFVRAYFAPEVAGNATEAARQAGYKGSESTLGTVGYENLRKPAIRREIDRQISGAFVDTELSVKKILSDIEVTRMMAIVARKFSVALRCSELQGKYLGMWDSKKDPGPMLEDVSTEDLIEMARRIQKRGQIDLKAAFSEDE